MKTRRFTSRVAMIIALSCAGAVILPAHATETKGTGSAQKAGTPVKVSAKELQDFHKAIEPLIKEGAEAFTPKDPKAPGKLREKSDFFEGGKLPEGLTTDIVLAGLVQQQSTDPRVDAYVKWEALSGLPAKFPDEMVARAVEAYRAAPKPMNHPGLDHAGFQAQLQKAGLTKDRKAVEQVNDVLDKMNAQYETNVDTIIKYRNEMINRLPTETSTVQAEVEDLYYRCLAAVPSKPMFDALREKVKLWSATAKPADINSVIPALSKIRDTVMNKKYEAYSRAEWSEGDKKKPAGLNFVGAAAFEPKYYDNFLNDLKDAARGGTGNPALSGESPKMDSKKKG